MKVSGVHRTLLLLGKVQLGTSHNDHRELIVEELFLRGIKVDSKALITEMKNSLIENEHPNKETDAVTKKFFPS